MAISNVVTMGWELAHSVCIELPQTDDSVNYFPVEIEPGKFAIGMFNNDLTLLGYIRTDNDVEVKAAIVGVEHPSEK